MASATVGSLGLVVANWLVMLGRGGRFIAKWVVDAFDWVFRRLGSAGVLSRRLDPISPLRNQECSYLSELAASKGKAVGQDGPGLCSQSELCSVIKIYVCVSI